MRKMIFRLSTFALFATVSCTGISEKGKDLVMSYDSDVKNVTRALKVDKFEKIALVGSVDVKYVQGDSLSVIAKGNEKDVSRLDATSDGSTLYIRYKKNSGVNINVGSGAAVVYVTSPDITAVSVKGSGDFHSKGRVDTDNMIISVKGSGDVSFDDLICDALNVSVYGSGDVEMKKVTTAMAGLETMGSGDISVNFDNSGVVESSVYGSGDISLKGTVRSEKHVVKGSGDVNTDKLSAR